MIRIKLSAEWASDSDTYNTWSRYMKPGRLWGQLQLVNDDIYDFLAIFNFPRGDYPRERSLLYQFEPFWLRSQFWDPRWIEPEPGIVAGLHTITRWRMPLYWYDNGHTTWTQLLTDQPVKREAISAVISDKQMWEGGVDRVAFVRDWMCAIRADVHLYGRWGNPPGNHFRGGLVDKFKGLRPYKYTIAAENCYERNYFTEKLIDGILSENLVFYSGCPNVADFLNPESFIVIDLKNPAAAASIINDAMRAGEWEKRIRVIREEKRRIMNEMLFFADLERHISLLS
jgi:hypothetical protein